MRTIAGVIIGLGLGILLMYFCVSEFRVSQLASPQKGAAVREVGVVFASDVSEAERQFVVSELRRALPPQEVLRAALQTGDEFREVSVAGARASSSGPPSCVLLVGGSGWPTGARRVFGSTDATPFVAYSSAPPSWVQCRLTVPVNAIVHSLAGLLRPALRQGGEVLLVRAAAGQAEDSPDATELQAALTAPDAPVTVATCGLSAAAPADVENTLRKALAGHPKCRAVVVADAVRLRAICEALADLHHGGGRTIVAVGCDAWLAERLASGTSVVHAAVSPCRAVVAELVRLLPGGSTVSLPIRVDLRPVIMVRPTPPPRPAKTAGKS